MELIHDREYSEVVYHRVYDYKGEILTKDVEGQYDHHRGIRIGWRHIVIGSDTLYNTWHNRNDVVLDSIHQGKLQAGKIRAKQVSSQLWLTRNDSAFIQDTREMHYWKMDANALIVDAHFIIRPLVDNLSLRGDPAHGGFQFRAHNDANDKHNKPKYVYNEGIEKDNKKECPMVGAKWGAMNYRVRETWNTMMLMDSPKNTSTIWECLVGFRWAHMSHYGEFNNVQDSVSLQYRMVFFKPGTEPDSAGNFYEGLYQSWVNPPEILVDGEIAVPIGLPQSSERFTFPTRAVFDVKGRITDPARFYPLLK